MKKIPFKNGVIHFIGIGGIGMSGIAEILHAYDVTVQGSDLAENASVARLRGKGIQIYKGHAASNITKDLAAVVVSSAIKQDNPEVQEARRLQIPIVRRADMLGELMRLTQAIAIGGTHGKTTTTSLVGAVLEAGGIDPTVINGGIVNSYGTNARLGQGDWVVVESDESDGSFTRLPATVAVVTNIDPEHMDHYGSFDDVKRAYQTFVTNIPFYGFAVLCLDHPEVQALVPHLQDRKIVTYGFSAQADVQAYDVRQDASGSIFSVRYTNLWEDSTIENIVLPMHGKYNIQNALVACAIAKQFGISDVDLKSAFKTFKGVKRRFTKTGEAHGISIIDDYGHHPIEITAVLKAARTALADPHSRVIAVMQPHRYSRLQDLFEDFSKSFNDADTVIISDVYEAGESPIEGVSKEALANAITQSGHKDVHVLEAPENLAKLLMEDIKASAGDSVICLGAGDITNWANALPDQLQAFDGNGAA